MKVLSLFDGISCARVALQRIGIGDVEYYASEIDKYAIQVAQKNFPDTVQIGSVTELKGNSFSDIDLLIGGSPCQDLSIAKKNRQGLKGERSGLFFEYVRLLNEIKPKFFVLENVNSMPKGAKLQISEVLGVEPVMINASLVSAQNRKRLFWVGKLVGDKYGQVPIPQPEDRGILLKDILESNVDERYYLSEKLIAGFKAKKGTFEGRFKPVDGDKSPTITAGYWKMSSTDPYILDYLGAIGSKDRRGDGKDYSRNAPQGQRVYSPELKAATLSANGGGLGAKTGLCAVPVALRNRGEGKQPEYNSSGKANSITTVQTDSMVQDLRIRKLTPIECERLQGLPDNYTEGVSNTQRYKALGNAFNVDVVAHILKHLWTS